MIKFYLFWQIAIAILVTLMVPTCSHAKPVKSKKEIRFKNGDIELGTLDVDDPFYYVRLIWTNPTKKTLEIDKVLPSCQCTNIKSSRTKVEPKGEIQFEVEIDLRSIRGHFGTGISLLFVDNQHKPLSCNLLFYRPPELFAVPHAIEFGEVSLGTVSSKQVTVSAVVDANDKLDYPETLAIDQKQISSRLVEVKSRKFRNPNTSRYSVRYDGIYTVVFSPNDAEGATQLHIDAKVRVGGMKSELVVPLRASCVPLCQPSPSSIVMLGNGTKSNSLAKTVVLSCFSNSIGQLVDVTCECDDDRVIVNYLPPKSGRTLPDCGKIKVNIRENKSRESFATAIKVRAEFGEKPVEFEVPLRFIALVSK